MIPKFRAWWKSEKVLIDEINWIRFRNKDLIGNVKGLTILPVEFDDVILMQSTGLKDKNGVEIFDGDIVRLVEESEDVAVSKVCFGEGAFGMDIEEMFIAFSTLKTIAQVGYTLEVIGNIHENPELLEVSHAQ